MGEMPENIDDWQIRGDQRYLYQMVKAIHSGVCSERLANMNPGPIQHARWLTTASRVLRGYVTKTNPSNDLMTITRFIMQVYAPFWFLVKSQPLAIHGSRHMFKYIQWIRGMPQNLQRVIQDSIRRNGFFCHHENILLSMITDTDTDHHVRTEGYNKILRARLEETVHIREFHVPVIKFDCESYSMMIDWNQQRLTEPPCIQFLPQAEIERLRDSDEIISLPGKKI